MPRRLLMTALAALLCLLPCSFANKCSSVSAGSEGHFDWNAKSPKEILCKKDTEAWTINLCHYVESLEHYWGDLSKIVYDDSTSTEKPTFTFDYTNGDRGGSNSYCEDLRNASVAIVCDQEEKEDDGKDGEGEEPQCKFEENTDGKTSCATLITVHVPTASCPRLETQSGPAVYLDVTLKPSGTNDGRSLAVAGEVQDTFGERKHPFNLGDKQDFILSFTNKAKKGSDDTEETIHLERPVISSDNSILKYRRGGDLAHGAQLTPGTTKTLLLKIECTGVGTETLGISMDITRRKPLLFFLKKRCREPYDAEGYAVSGDGGGMSVAGMFFLMLFSVALLGMAGGFVYNYQQLGLRGLDAVPGIEYMRFAVEKIQARLHSSPVSKSYVDIDDNGPQRPGPVASTLTSGYQDSSSF